MDTPTEPGSGSFAEIEHQAQQAGTDGPPQGRPDPVDPTPPAPIVEPGAGAGDNAASEHDHPVIAPVPAALTPSAPRVAPAEPIANLDADEARFADRYGGPGATRFRGADLMLPHERIAAASPVSAPVRPRGRTDKWED